MLSSLFYSQLVPNNFGLVCWLERPQLIKMLTAIRKKSGRNFTWILVFVFVLALLALLGFGLLNQQGSGNVKVPFSNPPPFTLKLFNGYSWENKTEISPATVKGRPLIINFWASWYIPCRDEAPVLEKLWREYQPKEVVFVGIAYQDRQEDSLAFLKRYGIDYPNGPDTTGEISIEYGTTGIPETWFISAEGKVIHKYVRPVTEAVMRSFLDELVKTR